MSKELRETVCALAGIAAVTVVACSAAWAFPRPPVSAIVGAIEVPHSSWLARCSELPIDAFDGIEIVKASVSQSGVAALLRKDKARGWLNCHKVGVYAGAPVYACYGPTALRDRMAASPSCSHAIGWRAVKDLPAAVKTWIAARSTCCGEATLRGNPVTSWPCVWAIGSTSDGTHVDVSRLDSIGPGVVGSESPCE